jgi:molybdate transport system substrate-binding protein
MSTVMEQLGSQFEGVTGHKLLPLVGFDFQLKVPLDAGDFDVGIFSKPTMDNLLKQGKVLADTRAEIARIGVGVAVKKGAPKPDISSAEAFKRALLNAKSISYTKDSGTGKYLASLMERLGIAEEMKPKTKLMGGSGQNPRAVAAGEVELGLSLISDILPVAGVELLGPLPSDLQKYTIVAVGVGTTAKEPEAARALVNFLNSPAAIPVIKAQGMEPLIR